MFRTGFTEHENRHGVDECLRGSCWSRGCLSLPAAAKRRGRPASAIAGLVEEVEKLTVGEVYK